MRASAPEPKAALSPHSSRTQFIRCRQGTSCRTGVRHAELGRAGRRAAESCSAAPKGARPRAWPFLATPGRRICEGAGARGGAGVFAREWARTSSAKLLMALVTLEPPGSAITAPRHTMSHMPEAAVDRRITPTTAKRQTRDAFDWPAQSLAVTPQRHGVSSRVSLVFSGHSSSVRQSSTTAGAAKASTTSRAVSSDAGSISTGMASAPLVGSEPELHQRAGSGIGPWAAT
eukprot:CAMPEP_0168424218 /NCGR_PEP_ID=MMETSP0228-20121227/34711_1 /TAXON_ID=133427 /ORGANISM="Protoceratium reticulatum, Strain CCCM 535 (=CCMP 1889)" /LENGTH=230 /DNA_ID=CAMNT_0008438205 /DNA_START=20 /DNA_END=708 /DNA_ORIENTATION=+